MTKCPHCGWDSKELTQREAQVEKFLINRPDLCMKEIASEMCITSKTVEVHKTAVYRKRGVRSRVELLHQAVVMGRFPVNRATEKEN